MNKHKILTISIISLAFILSIIFTGYLMHKELTRPQLPVLGEVKPFTLHDEKGRSFSSGQLKDKVWIANFVFTTCSDICPVMTANMAKLNRTFELVRNIKLISITVNPEYDTPNVLAEYAKKNGANPKKWHFLTGKREDITEIVVKNFKLGSIEEPVFHSGYFTLVDKYGFIRGYYDGLEQESLNKLFKDASSLLKQK